MLFGDAAFGETLGEKSRGAEFPSGDAMEEGDAMMRIVFGPPHSGAHFPRLMPTEFMGRESEMHAPGGVLSNIIAFEGRVSIWRLGRISRAKRKGKDEVAILLEVSHN